MLCTLCHRLYPAHYRKISGSRSSNFAKMPCQTLQIAQLSSSRACSLPTNPVHGTAGWTQPGSSFSKKIKAAFYAELIPLLDKVSEQSQHMLHKGSFPWHKKRRRRSILLGRVTGVTSAGGSDCSQCLKCSWTSLCPQKKNKLQSRKFIWAETRYKISVQNKFLNNSIGKCFWRRVGRIM